MCVPSPESLRRRHSDGVSFISVATTSRAEIATILMRLDKTIEA